MTLVVTLEEPIANECHSHQRVLCASDPICVANKSIEVVILGEKKRIEAASSFSRSGRKAKQRASPARAGNQTQNTRLTTVNIELTTSSEAHSVCLAAVSRLSALRLRFLFCLHLSREGVASFPLATAAAPRREVPEIRRWVSACFFCFFFLLRSAWTGPPPQSEEPAKLSVHVTYRARPACACVAAGLPGGDGRRGVRSESVRCSPGFPFSSC